MKNVHLAIPGIVEIDFSSRDKMVIDTQVIDYLLPVGTSILVDKSDLHEDEPHLGDNDVDVVARPSYQNPYALFLDEHEFEFAFRLVKNGISKQAIDDIMLLHTIKSNLPNGHFKSAHTLCKNIDSIDPDGIAKHWIMYTIDYDPRSPKTPYYWRDTVKVVKDLLSNPSY